VAALVLPVTTGRKVAAREGTVVVVRPTRAVVVVVAAVVVVVGPAVVAVVSGGRPGEPLPPPLDVVVFVVPPPETVRSRCLVDETGGNDESVTVSVTLNWPDWVGVPATMPPGL
jgi:hypothetical protein